MTTALLPSRERVARDQPLRQREAARIRRGPCGGWHHDDPRHPRADACRACLALGTIPRKDLSLMPDLTVQSNDLEWLLAAVGPHLADPDVERTVTQLTYLLLEVEEGRLRATATNRHTLATATIRAELGPGIQPGLRMALPAPAAAQIKILAGLAHRDTSGFPRIHLDTGGERLTFQVAGDSDSHTYGTDPHAAEVFPKWRSLFTGQLGNRAAAPVHGLRAQLLPLWGTATAGPDDPLLVTFGGALDQVVLRAGHPDKDRALLGLYAPLRIDDPAGFDLHDIDAWTAWVRIPAAPVTTQLPAAT